MAGDGGAEVLGVSWRYRPGPVENRMHGKPERDARAIRIRCPCGNEWVARRHSDFDPPPGWFSRLINAVVARCPACSEAWSITNAELKGAPEFDPKVSRG